MKAPHSRRVLLLQGPPSGFFNVLAQAFRDAGVPVSRINLHGGDAAQAPDGIPFRGKLSEFDGFVSEVIQTDAITDVLYFADRLPYHRIAADVADRLGATPYAIENGYVRPDWLTLEPGGMGAFSRFPVDRETIEALAADAPGIDTRLRYSHSFFNEAYCDVRYTLTRLVTSFRYPHFDRDRANHPLKEYLSWTPQLFRRQWARFRAPHQMRRVLAESRPFFLFPMQLQEDYQIRHNSRYASLSTLVDEVFASFAKGAPKHTSLLVKIHPLDNGLQNWRATLKEAKRDYGLTGRIRFLSAGPLVDMLENCEGVVLVNSTVGLTALREGCAVRTLGAAVYDLEGLTDRQPLDDFWSNPTPPDPEFVDAFVRALAALTQVKGSLYDKAGMRAASEEIVRRVIAGIGALPAFKSPPPRLERARELGVPLDLPVGQPALQTHG
ncbi:MAG: capsular biosynthesis protein [Pseudomonadota bacterium]